MTDLELKKILTDYTQKGADRMEPMRQELKRLTPRPAAPRRNVSWWVAAAAAAAVVLTVALTPGGRALAAAVGTAVSDWIETMFPPKEVPVSVEGEQETVTHMPHGEEPAVDPEGERTAGYVIYVDEERYTRTEQDGVMVIRPADPPTVTGSDGLPVPECCLTVEHRAGLALEDAQETLLAELRERCAQAEPVEEEAVPAGAVWLWAGNGVGWDALRMNVRAVDDGQGGVFVLTAQYFMEAAEGHGMRFAAMMDTFELVK